MIKDTLILIGGIAILISGFVFIVFVSVFVHEGVHIIQLSLDPRVEITDHFSIQCSPDAIACVKGVLVSNLSSDEIEQFHDEGIYREIQAYGIETVFIAVLSFLGQEDIQTFP